MRTHSVRAPVGEDDEHPPVLMGRTHSGRQGCRPLRFEVRAKRNSEEVISAPSAHRRVDSRIDRYVHHRRAHKAGFKTVDF